MPTFETTTQFDRDFSKLDAARTAAFFAVLGEFIDAVDDGDFPHHLRVKKVKRKKKQGGGPVRWEMTFSGNGRAQFCYGAPIVEGKRHVVWLTIGGHEKFDNRRMDH